MKKNTTVQYYVGHNKNNPDVILTTACKKREDVLLEMLDLYGMDWILDSDLEIALINITLASE